MVMKVIVDERTKDRLAGSASAVELCGSEGIAFGRFLPESEFRRLMCRHAHLAVTDDELEGDDAGPGEWTLTEIMSGLEKA